jgi:hypothetical protein
VLTHEPEAERVADIRIVRINRHGLAQKLDAFLVQPAHAVEIGEVNERGREVFIEAQGRLVLVLRLRKTAEPCLQKAKVHMRLRPVGIDHLSIEQLKIGGGESDLLLSRHRPLVHARERPCRFDAHRADRIAEQGSGRLDHGRRGSRRQSARRRGANERVGSANAVLIAESDAGEASGASNAKALARAIAGWP